MSEYSNRYLLYCKAKGNEENPKKQMEEDAVEWPGGKMAGFILWIEEKWYEFGADRGIERDYRTLYQKEFDTWLEAVV